MLLSFHRYSRLFSWLENMLMSRVVTAVPSESTFGKVAIAGHTHTHTRGQNTMCRKRGELRLPRDVVVAFASERLHRKSHVFIFSHWGSGQSRKIKTTTQARHTSQHGMSNGSKASQEAADMRTHMEMHCKAQRTLMGGVAQAATHMHG